MKEESYLGKFIPIRKLGSINNYDITFDRITINGKLYENVNFGLELAPGRVAVDQLYVSNDKGWIDTSFTLEAQGIRPNFAITIHNGSLSAPFLSAPGMLELKKIILDNFDLSKIDVSISGALKDLYQDDFAFRRVVFALRNDKNLLNIAKFDADLFKGRLQSSGSILLEPYTLNFVYALNSARVSEIARVLPEGALSSGGAISISGMWSTNGEKLDEQLYNLYIKSDVVAKDIVLGDFSLDEYIQELGNPTYNVNYFNDDLNKMLLTGQTQISDLTTGVELSKGVVTLQPLTFKTKYSTGTGSATFNLYDFSIDASSVFSFYVAKPKYGRSVTDYAPIKMTITAKGNFFTPKKEADTKKLVDFLKTRNQR